MESGAGTVHAVVFARVQRFQKVTEIVGRNVGRGREWEVKWVGGQGERDWDCAHRCVCEGPEGSES